MFPFIPFSVDKIHTLHKIFIFFIYFTLFLLSSVNLFCMFNGITTPAEWNTAKWKTKINKVMCKSDNRKTITNTNRNDDWEVRKKLVLLRYINTYMHTHLIWKVGVCVNKKWNIKLLSSLLWLFNVKIEKQKEI